MRLWRNFLICLLALGVGGLSSAEAAQVQIDQHKITANDLKGSKAGKRFEELREENAELKEAIKVTRGKKASSVLEEALAENLREAKKLGKSLNALKGKTIFVHGGKAIRDKARAVARATQVLLDKPKRYAGDAHLWVNKRGKLMIAPRAPNPDDVDNGDKPAPPPVRDVPTKNSGGGISGCTPIFGQPGTCQ